MSIKSKEKKNEITVHILDVLPKLTFVMVSTGS